MAPCMVRATSGFMAIRPETQLTSWDGVSIPAYGIRRAGMETTSLRADYSRVNVDTGQMAWVYYPLNPTTRTTGIHETADPGGGGFRWRVQGQAAARWVMHADRSMGIYTMLERLTERTTADQQVSGRTANWRKRFNAKVANDPDVRRIRRLLGSLVYRPTNAGARRMAAPAYSPDTGLFVPTERRYRMEYMRRPRSRGARSLGGPRMKPDWERSFLFEPYRLQDREEKIALAAIRYPGKGGNHRQGMLEYAG